MATVPEQKLHIGGRYVDAKSGKTFETLNPATNEVICAVHEAGADDVDDAVAAAREGFDTWSRKSGTERGRITLEDDTQLKTVSVEMGDVETTY